jgi:hypothetical protein
VKKILTKNPNPVLIAHMKTKTFGLTLAICFLAGAACFAANPQMGTWKLNEAKSKLSPGGTKNNTVVYQSVLFQTKVTIDGTDAKGKPTHNEWTGKFDGKDYPVTGDPSSDTRAIKQIDDHNYELTIKKGGKLTMTGKAIISADGKSRTVTVRGANAGKMVESTSVYDKQ